MSTSRAALVAVVVLAIVAVVALIMGRGDEAHDHDGRERSAEVRTEPSRLRGHGTAPALRSGHGNDAADPAAGGHLQAMADELIEVLDYRALAVVGVVVIHEIDKLDDPTDGPGRKWKTLAQGTTNQGGQVHLLIDRYRRRHPGEGLNHRLRLAPPKEREDLAPTWRIWKPGSYEIYRMSQSHVIEGRVLDATGEPVWQATVWIGDLPGPGIRLNNPAWRETKTDPDGHFRFAGIPTKADWETDVWAAAPGQAAPKSSSDIGNAQSVPLDSRHVEIRVE
jgi:hypothetical protein